MEKIWNERDKQVATVKIPGVGGPFLTIPAHPVSGVSCLFGIRQGGKWSLLPVIDGGRGVIDGLMLLRLKSGAYEPCRGPQIVGVECNKT